MLALLLVVSLLPMTAMADYIEIQPGDTVDEIKPGDATGSNPGTVNNNHGNVSTNTATIVNNGTAGGGRDSGRVSTNSGRIENNYGYVGNSYGTINHNQSGGYVSGNNSGGTVETNAENATIDSNVGTVGKKDESGNVIEGSGNSGTIKENYGTVFTNNATGIVESNDKRGTIEVNNGLVGKKDGKGNLITDGTSGNSGRVENNQQGGVVVNNSSDIDRKGIVLNNYSSGDGTNPGVINNGGKVSANRAGGTVVNNEGGYVNDNYSNGDGTSPGIINNGGTVNINNGTVDNLAGQVYSNNEGARILNNYGTVGALPVVSSGPEQYNRGIVETNHISGWVANNTTGEHGHGEGEVNTNYGTVYQLEKDRGWIYYYGLHGEDEDTDTMYTEKDYSLGHEAGEVNLDDTAASYQREGYKLSSYTVWTYDKTSTADDKLVEQNVGDRTKYSINAPTLLKLVWEKIVTAVAPTASSGGGEAVPTSYNPEYIGLGSVVTINGSRYKVVEIKDDALVVVSFDALPDEDVKDLDALFAKLFTAEQQKLIKNVGQLLDSEDVLTVFGKPGNHPVFEISKDLPK